MYSHQRPGSLAIDPSACRAAVVLTALLATLSCGSPGRPTTPGSGQQPPPPPPRRALFERDPKNPDLMAWDAGQRAEIQRLRGFGVVAVHYEQVGCDVTKVLPDCVGGAKYQYSPYYAKDVVIATNDQEAIAKLPLGAASLRGELAQGNARRHSVGES
ncbi:MAG: hypothetical protein JW940_23620 [Polyangiaceae bacterium]|nr:hypothetical protein [Polyangiaceae bacterium]